MWTERDSLIWTEWEREREREKQTEIERRIDK